MNTNRLQLLRHASVLPNYEALQKFLLINYIKEAKDGEPFIMFYQAEQEVRMVLAIGNTNSEYGCDLIDFKAVEAKVAELSEKADELSDELKAVVEAVEAFKEELEKEIKECVDAIASEAITREEMDAILARLCGFAMNERSGEYEYIHDVRDGVVGDAKSLAEAIDLLSKFVQDNNISYSFEKSKSVEFFVEENGNERKVKAEVLLSSSDRHKGSHDDNILVMYEDGLAATIDLVYNESKSALEFTKSSTASGQHDTIDIVLPFKVLADGITEVKTSLADLAVKDAELAGEIENVNSRLLGHEDAGKDEISIYGVRNRVDEVEKDVTKVVSKALEDAETYADNIASSTSEKALDDAKSYADEKDDVVKADLANEIERAKAAEKRALIAEVKDGKGIDLTRSIDENGTVLEAEVKLSGLNKNIISLKEDGLYAPEVQVDYDGVTNTITFKIGESETSYQLAGVKAIEDVRYDVENKNLIFTVDTESGVKETIVYLGDIVPSIESGSNEDSPIRIVVKKDTDKEGQFIANITAELNNVWDKDIKADFHVDTTDAEGTVVSTEKLENVHQVLEHLLNRIAKAFEILIKVQNLSINGIKPYDDEHRGIMELKGSDIKVGGDGEHSSKSVDVVIEELYKKSADSGLTEVKVKNGEDNNYLGLKKTSDAEDGHIVYTLDAKIVSLADADDDNTGLADAKDVKDAISKAVSSGSSVASGEGIDVTVEDAEDGSKVYTVSVKVDETSEDYLSVSENGVKIAGLDDTFHVISASLNDLNDRINAGQNDVEGINQTIEGMAFADSVSDEPEIVVKVSQNNGKIDVAKRTLNGEVDNREDGKSIINFTITDTQIVADIEIIDCGEF